MSSGLSGIDLLRLGDAGRKKPFLNEYWSYILGVTFGIGSGMAVNFGTRRPLFSGIQKHVLFTAGWIGLLDFIQTRRDNYLAEKDAVLRHYYELHPEDFPTLPRKRIGELLEPWTPIR